MNPEELRKFIQLIDKALEIAERRKEKLKTDEYRQWRIDEALKHASSQRQKELLADKNIEETLHFAFGYEALDKFIDSLLNIKEGIQINRFEKFLAYPKGRRPHFGLTRAISECGDSFGEGLYNEELGHAFFAIEEFFDKELD